MAPAVGMSGDLRCGAGLRRCMSEPQLRRMVSVARAGTESPPAATRLRTSRSMNVLSLIPNPIRSFLFEDDGEAVESGEEEKKGNWVERLVEIRDRWRDRQRPPAEEDDDEDCTECEECSAKHELKWDRESFGKLLSPVGSPETKMLADLAVLCNLAYVIPKIKARDLRARFGLWLVTTSLERKSEAAEIMAKLDAGGVVPAMADGGEEILRQPSAAYEIASAAASHIHSRAKGILSLGAASDAAAAAAVTVTAVVAAEEDARQQAARELSSLRSSPCGWFITDDPATATRCFVIQGSYSLASWQANLLFEPCAFEGTGVLVHRGIYEAAKGLYAQLLPAVEEHIRRHGGRSRLRFTGHSLGGSLALLLTLMLAGRRGDPAVEALLPAVTFGSPAVLCGSGGGGGYRVMEELGLTERHVVSVVMHRDIVPRAFSCSYPRHVAQFLRRLNGSFRSHPSLNNKEKLLYAPIGEQIILQPDKTSSPPHPLLPDGAGLYRLHDYDRDNVSKAMVWSGLRAFLNIPHPLETLSDPKAYGSEGTIHRDHHSSNYAKELKERVKGPELMEDWLLPLVAPPMVVPGLAWSPSWVMSQEVASLV